ncbi:alpha/beta hydrolase [Kineobactrum salinum]|uniref:Alpha/beta hydrolase fold domain-containing protein n=1 Tax=Kineobactrum salinum TaxID=2708301 RepID=A0A6C0U3S8_9GAMM|nr:alpha/beta hydrolase fold domain-containing protein [Kineobactrum salinum]QIB66820.1 alpha/beta hydrolase fold domain-containing protein [Kineobactrum salinum]
MIKQLWMMRMTNLSMRRVVRRMERASLLMRSRVGEPQVFSYGPSGIERMYYYPASVAGAPIHVHVHGGAWKQRKVEGVMFPAEMFFASEIGFASLYFISVDETNGDLEPMLEQVCRALAWIASHAVELDGSPDRLYLSGFSSGAHLAATAIAADWELLGFHHVPCKGVVLALLAECMSCIRSDCPNAQNT